MKFFDGPVCRDYQATASGQRKFYQHRGFGIEYDRKQYSVPEALTQHTKSSKSQYLQH